MKSLEKFADARVLVAGDVMLDRYWWGSVNRISPEAPVPVVSLQKDTFAPGGAANVAVNIAGLGAKACLLGIAGNDREADCLERSLLDRGVSTEFLVRLSDRRTSVKTRVIAHNQQVVRIDDEETGDLAEKDAAAVRDAVNTILPLVDLVIVSDYAKGLLSETVLSHLIERSRSLGKMVLVDPKGKNFSKYAGASMLTPNRREAAESCGLDEHIPDLVKIAGQKMLRELHLDSVLITESENGMTLFQKSSEPVHFDAHAQEIYDVTGAGDTVISCLGVALAAGASMREAADLANTAAGIVVGQIGTTAIKFAELEQAFMERPIGVSRS